MPLDAKVAMTKRRIEEWYDHWDGDVYLSYSGGKDSTVLLDIIRSMADVDDIPAVFCDTGLEYPEVRRHAIDRADVVLRPRMTFREVIGRYGYPFPSKEQALYIDQYRHTKSEKLRDYRWNGWPPNGNFAISKKWRFLANGEYEVSSRCCDVMKKEPFKRFERDREMMPIIATMATESKLRQQEYMQHGCNAFELKRPKSTPMGFWTEQDVLRYIMEHDVEIPSVYGDIVQADLLGYDLRLTGCQRTGCMFCMFGLHLEGHPNRFERMRETHPRQYEYCIDKLGIGKFLDYVGISY